MPPLAVSVALAPLQILLGPVMVTTTGGITVTTLALLPVQPFVVTDTLNVVVYVGVTVIEEVFSPVFHI